MEDFVRIILMLSRNKVEKLVGTYVKSTYRAQWIGIVLNFVENNDSTHCWILKVKMLIDRHGNPIRKGLQKTVWYSIAWFKPLKDYEIKI
mgnify:CR=1 FL=1